MTVVRELLRLDLCLPSQLETDLFLVVLANHSFELMFKSAQRVSVRSPGVDGSFNHA